MRLYLDANVIIYGVEGAGTLRTAVLDWVDRVEAQNDGFLLTSELSLLECLVKPTRDSDEERVRDVGSFSIESIWSCWRLRGPCWLALSRFAQSTVIRRPTRFISQRRSSTTQTRSSRPMGRWRSSTSWPFTS